METSGESLIAGGIVKPVAPAWQPYMIAGGEAFPVGLVLMFGVAFICLIPSMVAKAIIAAVMAVLLALLRFIGEQDDRYFATPMGFNDREEYIASATVQEFERDLGSRVKVLGIF